MTTVASLFDGIGGTPLAARLSGAECLWCSEIEKFPQMVTKHHFPSMKHYGDITKINGAKVEPVDIIVGGSPCQDLSVAGKRQGMKHSDFGDEETTRSGLFMEQIRIVKEMRDATETNQPRFMVWENVPGAFSSNKGEDFRAVLEETAKIKDKTISIPRPVGGKWANAGCIMGDGFSIAWRTYDAQYWGVAQRRRRIYLVADFGGQSAPEILFECPCVSGHSAESGSQRQGAAGDVERSVGEAVDVLNDQGGSVMTTSVNIVGTLRAQEHGHQPIVRVGEAVCYNGENITSPTNAQNPKTGDPCHTLGTDSRNYVVTDTPTICLQGSMIGRADKNGPQGDGVNEDVSFTLNTTDRHAVCFGMCSYASNSMKSRNPYSGIYEADTSRTIDVSGGNPACNQGGIMVVEPTLIEMTSTKNIIIEDGICPTLTARMGTGGNQVNAVCSSVGGFMQAESEMSPTMMARDYKDPHIVAQYNKQVRRLTPLECERLQGYPDGWTDIPPQKDVAADELKFWRGVWDEWDDIQGQKHHSDKQIIRWLRSESSDTARYKALGNSFAMPNILFVMKKCVEVTRCEP